MLILGDASDRQGDATGEDAADSGRVAVGLRGGGGELCGALARALLCVHGPVGSARHVDCRLTEHDMEPLRVAFFGSDTFTWRLLVSFLLLSLDRPTDVLPLEFLPLGRR